MAYESTPPRVKTRSASISAPTSGSLETILNPPSSNGTPEIGYQRRRPATRTQSARITGARSVRRKVHTQQHNLHESRSHCASEPRLNETETPPQRRRASQKRPTHTQSQRKSNAYLDVPSANFNHLQISDNDDEDVDRLRTFSASKGAASTSSRLIDQRTQRVFHTAFFILQLGSTLDHLVATRSLPFETFYCGR
ncbi:uncharacterized protein LOC129575989 [Sitodiplosis mosellana]|uniref:uncharacterized protein LOC129575989 n=1 Tax=Sitodiplosis mosellana TaxID=263140 RepID=UPI002444AABB|nr:uncharacterized protein LOC129575989 [Sitodiplosis mosellana]XP_055316267.1 uncharacterized protein LOC129575989 [Sitodiplosis mosellana]XP_055316268.1 uncharacterized protein LOC129575989 [Sitodiplosis mosellana]XP_055316269.1 uncharacterized protein LOC129575989 [Sitodiplosis mosellana]XP_055316270.1 uncharacterized protein LOC129575989 [Sitodiplosis mosellana]